MYLSNAEPPNSTRDKPKHEAPVTDAISKEASRDRDPGHPDAQQKVDATVDSEPSTTRAATTSAAAVPSARANRRIGTSSKRPRGGGGGIGAPSRIAASAATRNITYGDLGGIDAVLYEVQQLIEFPIKHPEVYEWLGVQPPRGVLLYGPPGCGKTALANAIASECGVPFFRISAPEIVSGMSGESEAKMRTLFADAAAAAPAIVFIDEIDVIGAKRETAQREMERRIVAQLVTCMDDLSAPPPSASLDDTEGPVRRQKRHVSVIGATNRPEVLDSALRRAGRFDREISLGVPSGPAREAILQVLTRGLRLDNSLDIAAIARLTPGYVGADLAALAAEAASAAVRRAFLAYRARSSSVPQSSSARAMEVVPGSVPAAQQTSINLGCGLGSGVNGVSGAEGMDIDAPAEAVSADVGATQTSAEPGAVSEDSAGKREADRARFSNDELRHLAISMADFEVAVTKVQPSLRREGFTTKPDVTWQDVGSLEDVREELDFAISQPIRFPERFRRLGLSAAAGVLLFGPPGCGKTLVAKAVAAESGANFISIKGPELLNKYVGESERAVRALFGRAHAAAPCVLFFDELDALAPKRGSENNASTERVVNQLLTEMDGTADRRGVFIIAASNRPDILDPALLRPGRLDKSLYVPLPDATGRARILEACVRRSPLADDVDLPRIAFRPECEGLSGADLASLLREAAIAALKEVMKAEDMGDSAVEPVIHQRHFETALASVRPSVSAKDTRAYDRLRDRMHQAGDSRHGAKAVTSERGAQEGGKAASCGAVEVCLREGPIGSDSKDELRGDGE